MKRLGWVLSFVLLLLLCPQAARTQDDPGEEGLRFVSYAVVVDAGQAGLASWQLKVTAKQGEGTGGEGTGGEGKASGFTLTGVEGAAELPFQNPPYYDPAALQQGRIVLAGFTTQSEGLPTGKVRVATLHAMLEGPAPELEITLVAAGDGAGQRLAKASVALIRE